MSMSIKQSCSPAVLDQICMSATRSFAVTSTLTAPKESIWKCLKTDQSSQPLRSQKVYYPDEFNGIPNYRFASSGVEVPSMGESITDGIISSWKKQPGDAVAVDEVLAVIDTDKISVEVIAPFAGVVESIDAQEGDTVEVGKVICTIKEGEAGSSPNPVKSSGDIKSTSHDASPSTSGHPNAEQKMSLKTDSKIDNATREERRVPMTRMRLRIAERLKAAQTDAACLTTFQECDMSAIMALRKQLGPQIQEKYNTKLGFMSFFMAACARVLEEIPMVNASIDSKELLMRNYVDISVAVATPNGLTVPVVRDVQKKSLVQLEQDLANLAKKARNGQISLDDMAGGTFTISNGGIYGSLMGTPILNQPQSAILGMHSIVERPVVRNGNVVIRPMMYLALTYDHRVVDGKEAVTFLKTVTDYIENPMRLLQISA